MLHRLIVIGHLPHGLLDNQNLICHYERLNQRLQRCCLGESITGLLLLYPACFLHIIECSSEILVSVLEDLKSLQENADNYLTVEPRLLLLSHDLPSRLYFQWNCTTLRLPASTNLPDTSAHHSTQELISHTLDLALRMGSYILKKKGPGTKPSLETLEEEAPELIIPQDVLLMLLKRNELLSPLQYLQVYHSPLTVLLDSEPVWHSLEYLPSIL
ncbi:testis-expressed protein 47 [Electrophorus electricus]|uniref:testis-expressed protein 47 n=1 Tax=Electrophorus electricus TaxID=8005 RepID=UPI0015CFB7D7|nr:testis-expressed protein 47 [Electrophorus electricus]